MIQLEVQRQVNKNSVSTRASLHSNLHRLVNNNANKSYYCGKAVSRNENLIQGHTRDPDFECGGCGRLPLASYLVID